MQVILQEVTRIVSQLDLGQIPLYEAIMMVNRLVVQEVKTQDTFVNQEFDRPGNTLHEIPVQEKKEPPMEELSVLMNRVVLNKKQLEESIMVLNGSLQAIGFELRSIKD